MEAMQELMRAADARVIASAAICTEGDGGTGAIALAHLPLFTDE